MIKEPIKKRRIALIGLGDIAQKAYLPVVANHHGIEPILCTRNKAVLMQLAEKYRIGETYDSLASLIDAQPDAVMIHSATHSHFDIAKQCLAAGIAVFVDKPMSYTLAECEQLTALSNTHNVPLFVGFNRRYAPLYQVALKAQATQVHYQKNRHNLPADVRTFIFDDFIHVLDFVLFSSGVDELSQIDIDIYANKCKNGQLNALQVQWTFNGALYRAAMNRVSGKTFERLEYFSANQHWQIDNLRKGVMCQNETTQPLAFNDWQSTLYKRGFDDMLEAFIDAVKAGSANTDTNQASLLSHQLAEWVVAKIGVGEK